MNKRTDGEEVAVVEEMLYGFLAKVSICCTVPQLRLLSEKLRESMEHTENQLEAQFLRTTSYFVDDFANSLIPPESSIEGIHRPSTM